MTAIARDKWDTGPHLTFKLTKDQAREILYLRRRGFTHQDIADMTGISRAVVQRLCAHPDPMSACHE